jgi:hypothetical protein
MRRRIVSGAMCEATRWWRLWTDMFALLPPTRIAEPRGPVHAKPAVDGEKMEELTHFYISTFTRIRSFTIVIQRFDLLDLSKPPRTTGTDWRHLFISRDIVTPDIPTTNSSHILPFSNSRLKSSEE